MSEEDFKKLWDNPPKDSELVHLKESMEKGAIDTINGLIKELMTEYSLSYAEAFIILKREWDKYYNQNREKDNDDGDNKEKMNEEEIQKEIDRACQEKGITAKFTPKDIEFLRHNEPVPGSLICMKVNIFYYNDIIDVEKSSTPGKDLTIYCKENYDMDEFNKFVENEVPWNVEYETKVIE